MQYAKEGALIRDELRETLALACDAATDYDFPLALSITQQAQVLAKRLVWVRAQTRAMIKFLGEERVEGVLAIVNRGNDGQRSDTGEGGRGAELCAAVHEDTV